MPASLAPPHLRLFALLCDYLFAIAGGKLLEQALLGRHWDLQPQVFSGQISHTLLGAMVAIVLCKDALWGISPGKWLMGIAVGQARQPATAPAFWRLVLRNGFLLLLPLEGVLLFLSAYYQRLGDRISDTVVVLPAHRTPLGRRLVGLICLFLLFMLLSLLLPTWNIHRSAALENARAAALSDPGLRKLAGPEPRFEFSPGFQLNLDAQGGIATVTFTTSTDSFPETRVTVTMRLEAGASAWKILTVAVAPVPKE